MSMHFRDLAEQVAADGAIAPEEILSLRRAGWTDGHIQPEEAEAIFAINDRVAEPSIEWSDFFVEALSEFLVNGCEPRGYVSDGQGDWLIARIDHNGKLDSMTELELLVKVLERAQNAPDQLKSYALAQIEQAVLSGVGPTRDGGALAAGNVTETEARLLRRIIFAQAGERPGAVGRGEAEMLFRLKDATLGADNAPEWKRLFVQGVGNYLQGFGGHEALSRERAAELEHFMNDTAVRIGGFFSRMADSAVNGGVRSAFGRKGAVRDRAEEAEQAARVTDEENLWLQDRIDANDRLDEYDQALLDFIREG